jgi:hypothetical protein
MLFLRCKFNMSNQTFLYAARIQASTDDLTSQRGLGSESLKAFPAGFRMLAGDPWKRNFTNDLPAKAISYACLGAGKDETNNIPNYNCPGGLRAQVFFPSCWDGKNLDSSDHKSHMSYPAGNSYNSGGCPDSHPVHLISIFYEILYDTNKFAGEWYGSSHPFVFANGDATGYGLHGDFVNGWDIEVLQAAVTDCTADSGKVEDCSHFTQYTGAECQNCRLPTQIDEQVDGWMEQLPGCNPITSGPGYASKPATCDAANTIGQASTNFVDLTVSKKWEYVGCGTDDYYDRAMGGSKAATDTMTVETCVDLCKSSGFSYAGLEYSRECYCANSIPADKAPIPGVMGNCQMKCSGDDKEFCGGASALSIYHACGNDKCENVQYGGNGNSTTTTPTTGNGASTGNGNGAPAEGEPAPSGTKTAAAGTSTPSAVSAAEEPTVTLDTGNKGVDDTPKPSTPAVVEGASSAAPATPSSTGEVEYYWDCDEI